MSFDSEPDISDTAEFVSFNELVAKFFEREPRAHARVEVAGSSHPGNVRPNNEDHYLVVKRYRGRDILATNLPEALLEASDDQAYIMSVADGMGGRNFGELASLLALRAGWELGSDEIKWMLKKNEREEAEMREKADVFARMIDQMIHAEIRENPRLTGMGTTLTIAYTIGPHLYVIHVGDSRAYLYRGGTLRQLTHDHNLGQVLVDAGEAAPNSAEVKKLRHVLTNVLGGPNENVSVDLEYHRLKEGDRVLLCTDGLNDMVDDAEIARTLESHPASADACAALVARALERGGKDNVTVVVARYQFGVEPEDE